MVVNNTMGIRVFVYGSLKRGCGNHGLLADTDFLGYEILRGKYSMLDLRYYPALVHDHDAPANRGILGEVYRVSKAHLDSLDMLEGHPDYYARMKVQTQWKGAWGYFLPLAYKDTAPAVPETVNGVQIWHPKPEEVAYVNANAAANG